MITEILDLTLEDLPCELDLDFDLYEADNLEDMIRSLQGQILHNSHMPTFEEGELPLVEILSIGIGTVKVRVSK